MSSGIEPSALGDFVLSETIRAVTKLSILLNLTVAVSPKGAAFAVRGLRDGKLPANELMLCGV